jgi:hypothetical protein
MTAFLEFAKRHLKTLSPWETRFSANPRWRSSQTSLSFILSCPIPCIDLLYIFLRISFLYFSKPQLHNSLLQPTSPNMVWICFF